MSVSGKLLRAGLPFRLRSVPNLRHYSSDEFEKLTQQLLASTPKKDVEWDETEMPPTAINAPVQKDELIFKEVLGQVLSNTQRPRKNKATTQPQKRSALSDSILALFDKPAPSSEDRSISSLMDGLLQGPESITLTAEETEKRQRAAARVALVTEYIGTLETNAAVVNYFEETVIPRFTTTKSDREIVDPLDPVVTPDTVALILAKCVSTLRHDFKDPLGALHLFETAKFHSIELFTEACSADVYNEIIKIRWEDYRDLYAVVSLASEIAINAIQPNLETTELLSKIYREALDSSKSVSVSALGMPLWTGQDVKRLDELNRYRTRFQSTWASKPILRI